MGLSEGAVKLYLELYQRGHFEDLNSVIEMGSQELHIRKPAFERLVEAAGITEYDKESFNNLEHFPNRPRCPAKPFYELLGAKEYKCVDLNGAHGSLKHDLNKPMTDTAEFGRYDLVTDHGANEHVFDIVETYRTVHRLCKTGGIITISQEVFNGNGYYNFDPSFFEGMAAANNYTILFSSFLVQVVRKHMDRYDSARLGQIPRGVFHDQFHIPVSRDLLDVINWSGGQASVGISYVYRKNSDDEFKNAYQDEYQAEAHWNSGYELQFLPVPPSRTYIPVRSGAPGGAQEGMLGAIPLKILLRHLLKRFRILSRIKARLRR